MRRNKNIDIIRSIAILSVVFYHIFAITGITINYPIIRTFIFYGGEFGVSIFFILSGYSIYCSLKNKELSGEKFSYWNYLGKRIKRLAPQYYFSLSLILLFTGGAVYLSQGHLLNLFSHVFFFHNLFPSIAGAISGVCWTLGVIFQFYIIAPYIYKIIKKYPKITMIISVIISIVLKYLIFHFIFSTAKETNSFYYFSYGRQLFTSIDHFVLGMFIAQLGMKENKSNNICNVVICVISIILLYILLRVGTFINIPFINNTGIYSDCTMGYIWHSIMAIILGLGIYSFSKIKLKLNSLVGRFLLFISKYEYGIYIWHLILISTLFQNSQFIQIICKNYNPIFMYIILTALSICVGYVMTKLIDNLDYSKFFKENKDNIFKFIKVCLVLLVIYCVYKTVLIIKPTINNFNTYLSDDVVDNNGSKKIADNAKELMNEKACKYIYIDGEGTGYLYFYHLRYYLSPCESINFNTYISHLVNRTSSQMYDYFSSQDFDYFIIKENETLEKELDIKFDKINGSIFKKNKDAKNIKDLFIKVE